MSSPLPEVVDRRKVPEISHFRRLPSASIPVIRRTGEDRFGAVELFEGDKQREFVLEGLRAE